MQGERKPHNRLVTRNTNGSGRKGPRASVAQPNGRSALTAHSGIRRHHPHAHTPNTTNCNVPDVLGVGGGGVIRIRVPGARSRAIFAASAVSVVASALVHGAALRGKLGCGGHDFDSNEQKGGLARQGSERVRQAGRGQSTVYNKSGWHSGGVKRRSRQPTAVAEVTQLPLTWYICCAHVRVAVLRKGPAVGLCLSLCPHTLTSKVPSRLPHPGPAVVWASVSFIPLPVWSDHGSCVCACCATMLGGCVFTDGRSQFLLGEDA